VPTYIHKDMKFSFFHLMMKQYRQRRDITRLLSNFTCNDTTQKTSQKLPYHFISQGKIISESLFLRVQEVLLLSHGQPHGQPLLIPAGFCIRICPHVTDLGDTDRAIFLPRPKCKLKHRHNLQRCIRHYKARQCEYCPTEYTVDLQECERLGTAVVVTKWIDLGQGRSVMDPKWWSHLSGAYTEHDVFFRKARYLAEDAE
jgi:hypothetical protein